MKAIAIAIVVGAAILAVVPIVDREVQEAQRDAEVQAAFESHQAYGRQISRLFNMQ